LAVNHLKQRLIDENLWERFSNPDIENDFFKLLRFLRARKFNVDQSFAMIQSDIPWREADNRLCLPQQTATEVLQCDIMRFYTYFPTWIQGVDRQNRPVSYRKFGQFEIWNVLKLTSFENLMRFHAWETEMAILRMRQQSQATGYNIETFTCVIDSGGWGMRLATSDAFAFIKGMASVDSDHYPERLGNLVVVNAPSMLAMAWRVIQTFLDDVTKAKIKIFSSNRKEWEPVLQSLIDPDQIPAEYGGNARNLEAEEAILGMNP
jgi:hypothetical protein